MRFRCGSPVPKGPETLSILVAQRAESDDASAMRLDDLFRDHVALLSALLESAPEPVVVVDRSGRFRYANAACESLQKLQSLSLET